jgi:hypothetical protein
MGKFFPGEIFKFFHNVFMVDLFGENLSHGDHLPQQKYWHFYKNTFEEFK